MIENEEDFSRPEKNDRRNRFGNSMLGLGKLPPQATDLEATVLGSLMMEKSAMMDVADILIPECFYEPRNQMIFKVIIELFHKNNPIDILTVTSALRQAGDLEMIGGAYYITELTGRVSSAANIEFHARVIYQKYLQREVIRISTEAINFAYEDTTDVFDLIENTQMQTFGLLSNLNSNNITDMEELGVEFMEDIVKKPIDGLTGVGTGYKEVDRITGGWQKTDLIIIAARPSMGKTAFAMCCAKNAALIHKVPVLIFSLEMSKMQLMGRMASDHTDVPHAGIRKKSLAEWHLAAIHTKLPTLTSSKIFIDDTPGINIFEMRVKARRMIEKHGIGLIVIDYLQLMEGLIKGKNQNREQEISTIARSLKTMAKEFNVPVIALSQLSRTVENRPGGNKRPQLSDLRESGSIEQDADQVLFLYRPEYYGITQDEAGRSVDGLCEIIFSKNRNGKCEMVKTNFNGAYMRFSDWESESSVPEERKNTEPEIQFTAAEEEQDLPF